MTNADDSPYYDLQFAGRQQAVLIEILQFYLKHGKSPTYRELEGTMRTSRSNIHRAVGELRQKGYIEKGEVGIPAEARELELTDRSLSWLRLQGCDISRYARISVIKDYIRAIPVLGEIAAGNPIFDDGNIRGQVILPAQHLPIGEVYILDVVGHSMIEDGVLDGDQVLVVPYPDPKGDGEMVVALIEGAATVKRFWRNGDAYNLEPSNSSPEYKSMPIRATDKFLIQGRVIGLLRWRIR
jgi:repressor LexA